MGGSTVLERLATLETEMAYVRTTVDGLDAKLDRMSDLVAQRITMADTRTGLYASALKYGAWATAGLLGLVGGSQYHALIAFLNHLPSAG